MQEGSWEFIEASNKILIWDENDQLVTELEIISLEETKLIVVSN